MTELNDNSNLQTSTRAGLRALEVATLTAQRQAVDATGKLRELRAFVAAQAADFKITWTWDGTIHFVQTDDRLAPARPWLESFFKALQGENREVILGSLGVVAERLSLDH